jgi:tryptophanyl-tRNA synthetase
MYVLLFCQNHVSQSSSQVFLLHQLLHFSESQNNATYSSQSSEQKNTCTYIILHVMSLTSPHTFNIHFYLNNPDVMRQFLLKL